MQHFKLIPIVCFSCVLLMSCGNNSSTKDNTNATTVSSASSGKGNITCTIDGKPVSITVQNSFFEMRLDVYSKGANDGIELLDGSAKKEGFQFEIKNSGTTKIKSGSLGDINCIISYYASNGNIYSGDDAVITITSFSGDHLTGTFSGKFVQYGGASGTIQITDGKFDLQK
jgi:hypothetical protein